ncbi:hypothetical protein GQ457_02G022970 [Hibiscus cannabinus]
MSNNQASMEKLYVAEPTRDGHTGNIGVKSKDPTPRSTLLEREPKLESLVSGAQNHNNNNAVLKQVTSRTYDSLDIAKHNLINIWLITHPTKPMSISRLTQHSTKVEPTTHSGSLRSSHNSLSGMLRSNL